MGLWATCFQVGGVLARWPRICSAPRLHLQLLRRLLRALCHPRLVFNQRNQPEDVGLALADPDAGEEPPRGLWRGRVDAADRLGPSVLNTVLLVGGFYARQHSLCVVVLGAVLPRQKLWAAR